MQHHRHKYKKAGGSQRHREAAVEELYTDKEGEVKIRRGTLCLLMCGVCLQPVTYPTPGQGRNKQVLTIHFGFFPTVTVSPPAGARGHEDPLKKKKKKDPLH